MTAPSNHSGFAENADRTTSCYEAVCNTQGGIDLSDQSHGLFCGISKTQGWALAHRFALYAKRKAVGQGPPYETVPRIYRRF
jgi:hypothetical protein